MATTKPTTKDPRPRITIYPDADLKARIEAAAKKRDRDVNNFLIVLVKAELKRLGE